MAISHVFTNPVPDGTITSIVRPSDWNSAHNQYYTLSGNVLGASTVSGTNVVLQAAGNVSLSGVNQTIVISGSNTPQPTSYVSNVNGISGQVSLNAGASLSGSTNGSSITFALASNITTALQSANPNYLTTQTVQTQASGNIVGSGFTSTTTTGTAVVGTLNSSGLSLGVPAFLTAAAGGGGVAIAGGTQTATSGTVNFANSNGITFGMSGSNQITASYTVPTVPTSYVSNVNGSSGQISLNVGSSLSSSTNGSSITFGLVTDITTALQSANANYLTSQSNQAFSASGGSSTFQTLNFANSNGVTFSNTNGSVRITHDLQYTSNTSAITANAFPSADTTKFAGTGTTAVNATVTLNSNGINISVAAPGGGGNFSGGVSNLGNTAGSTGITGTRVVFVGTNNISLSQSTDANGATISFDQTGGGGGAMYANLSGNTAGNSTASGNTLNFSGINVTLSGTNNSQIAISAPATTALVAGNNISLSANASTVTVRAQAVAVSAGSQLATSGTLLFSDANGVTFGMNGSSRITASYTQRTTYAFSASGGSSSWATLNFANSNGLTFSNSNGSVVASYTVPDTTGFAGTGFTSTTTTGTAVQGTLSTNGLSLAVPAFITAGGGGGNFSGGVSDLGNTAGSTGITGTRIVFVGTNNISLSQSTDANGATISINQTGNNFSAGISSLGNTNTVLSSGITGTRLVFAAYNNITLGQYNDTAGATINIIGANLPPIASGYSPHADYPMVVGEMGQASLVLDPDIFPNLTVDQVAIPINFSHALNSTGSFTISNWIGLYSRSNSSISLAHSTSFSTGITFSGTQNSISYIGMRLLTYNWSTSVSEGRYWIAQIVRTATAGTSCSFSQYLASQINSSFLGPFGISTNATYQFTLGQGFYSTTTTALPASIAFSQIRGAGPTSGSLGLRFPIVQFGYNSV